MMITQLNVINVFTDEFDQIKAEGKSEYTVTVKSECCNNRVFVRLVV